MDQNPHSPAGREFDAAAPARRPGAVSRIALVCALAAPAIFLLLVVLQPGWGSPLPALGGLAILLLPPTALILAVAGLISGKSRGAAIAALILGCVQVAFLGAALIERFCR